MNTQTLLLDSLNTRWDTYKTELKNCRDDFSEDAVHDFRVAVRRLLALLDLLRTLMRDAKVKKIRQTLKDQLDNLDELRDTQVMLDDISQNILEVPQLQPLEEYLQRREKKLMRAARREIKTLKIVSLSRRMVKLRKNIEAVSLADLDSGLLPAVDNAFASATQLYAQVDPAQSATIHRLRIAFKKFRYVIEAIHPILDEFPIGSLKKMQAYQTSMGEIQDMDVALQMVANFEKHAPAAYDPKPIRSYYKERQTLAISRYIEDKGEVFTFWRTMPDQSFLKET